MKTLVVTPYNNKTGATGLEPVTQRLTAACSTNWAKLPECADGVPNWSVLMTLLIAKDRHTVAVHSTSSGERTWWLSRNKTKWSLWHFNVHLSMQTSPERPALVRSCHLFWPKSSGHRTRYPYQTSTNESESNRHYLEHCESDADQIAMRFCTNRCAMFQ